MPTVETEIGPVEILYMVRDDSVIICSVDGQVHYPVAQEDACVLINRLIQEKQELKSALQKMVDAGNDILHTSLLGDSQTSCVYEVELESYQRLGESTRNADELLDNQEG